MNEELVPMTAEQMSPPAKPLPSPIMILESAVNGGITQENVAVVKELVAMCREQRAEDAKAAFAKAFFQLRKNMPEIYADKEAKTKSGEVAYTYCSEHEIAAKIEPVLLQHGFTTLFGQEEHDGKVTVKITLMHEGGHSETREFTVRSGSANAMKDATACDTGAATTAWRHLKIKMFGLKSRISENQDPRLLGEIISQQQAEELQHRLKMVNGDETAFLKFCGVVASSPPCAADYLKIHSSRYESADAALSKKEKAGR